MKNIIATNLNGDHIMLTACIWCANLDFTGLADYAIKAIIGGIIWFGFKFAADYITAKFKNKKNQDE